MGGYIRDFKPDREPAAAPEGYGYGEITDSPSKTFVLANRDTKKYGNDFRISIGRRRTVRLRKDPAQLNSVAGKPAYAKAKQDVKEQLENRLRATSDPRLTGGQIIWDSIPFYGPGRI